MMKRITIVLFILAIGVVGVSAYEVDVSTTAMVVMPQRGIEIDYVPEWSATNAYVNGEYVSIGNGAYMCLESGTSGATIPTSLTETISDGTVVWVRSKPEGRVLGIVSKSVSTSDVHLDFQSKATTTSGWVLYDKGSFVGLSASDGYDGEISAISASGTNTLTIGDK